MKATINGIQFEGTPQEMMELLASSKNISDEEKQPVKKPIPEVTFKAEEQTNKYFSETDEFLAALFRYKPSNTSMGREAYVVQMLATGESYTIKQLVRGARTQLHTVRQAIDRAVAAGCVIHATRLDDKQSAGSQSLTLSSKVKMISLGTVDRAKEVKSSYEKKNNKRSVLSTTDQSAQELQIDSASSDKKLKASKTTGIIHTGSAPITKIIYAEDRKKNEQQ